MIVLALPPVLSTPPAPRQPLEGKGFFVWLVGQCQGGDPQAIAMQAQQAGLSHVLVKVAHGPNPYRYNIGHGLDRVGPLVAALRSLIPGFQVWGWQYTLGADPEGDARIAVTLVRQYQLDGFVINAEQEYKHEEIRPNAARYAQALEQNLQEAELADLPVGLSSYRYPQLHPEFPWEAFQKVCTVMMPQVYWVAREAPDPVANLQRSVQQYRAMGWTGPIVPTGAAYDEWQRTADGTKWLWSTTPEQIRQFLPAVRQAGLPAANFWSWDGAGSDRWQAVAEFQW
ncbi:MAG: hypothetical protein FJ026_12920 [Chloroflexi bacterium]|nr:hypothetical protein [Chloroflexota bacterium]